MVMHEPVKGGRQFLFLQGPPGPFFHTLGEALRRLGAGVHRINLCGGDEHDWPDPARAYRGTLRRWPLFLDRFLRDAQISDLVLFGDCRPMHQAALRIAQLRGIHIHVFEEGYIRPDWMTLERDGVNGHSPIDRDPQRILAAASDLPPVPDLPRITAEFRRRARDSYWHYHHVFLGRWRFPFFRTHRPRSLLMEGLGWLCKLARERIGTKDAALSRATIEGLEGRKFFLFPLQLSGDYQIRVHSPFQTMQVAADYVVESFARFAAADSVLLVKEHPLDNSFRSWRRRLAHQAKRAGVTDRIIHIAEGDLEALARASHGMVCVNSTSGTLALEFGKPVVVLGDAVYDIPGITHQAGLDSFWTSAERPNPVLYDAFKRLLHAKCLVRGGLASKSGMEILVENSVVRLLSRERRSGGHAKVHGRRSRIRPPHNPS